MSSENREKLSKIQSTLLDIAENQNLKKLKYDDNAIHRRNTFLYWIKQLNTALACHCQFSSVIMPSGRISSLPQEKHQLNHALHIIINSFVGGHWKDIGPRPQYIYVEALKKIQLMLTTLAFRC
jgi:hypothetical protein